MDAYQEPGAERARQGAQYGAKGQQGQRGTERAEAAQGLSVCSHAESHAGYQSAQYGIAGLGEVYVGGQEMEMPATHSQGEEEQDDETPFHDAFLLMNFHNSHAPTQLPNVERKPMATACRPRRESEAISCLSLPMVTPSMKSNIHTRGVMARPGSETRLFRDRNPTMKPVSMQEMMTIMTRIFCRKG